MSYPMKCGHCGSSEVFRRMDGDIGCNDCRAITTTGEPTAEDARDALTHLDGELSTRGEREVQAIDILTNFIDNAADNKSAQRGEA